MTPKERKEFVVAYLECALWLETAYGVPEDTGDGNFYESFESYGFTLDDIEPEAKRAAFRDCLDFLSANDALLVMTDGSPTRHGYDFWLTRNGHGAGFWDRGYGKVGDVLTKAAKVYGNRNLYARNCRVEGF